LISKEEYKKTLIRILDSVREEGYAKGEYNCDGVKCEKCPIESMCGSGVNMRNVHEAIEFVEQWAKEHPIETNGSRFLKNYPKAEIYNYDDEFIFVRLDRAENHIKIPRTWWESEVDDANCD